MKPAFRLTARAAAPVLLLLCPLIAGEPGMQRLNLKESVKLGLLNNADLLLAKTDMDILDEKSVEVVAGKYPQLEAYAGYTRARTDSLFSVLPRDSGDMLLLNGQEDYYQMRLALQQILFAGTKFSNARRLADASKKRQQKEYEVIRNRTVFAIKRAFYEALYRKKLAELLDEVEKLGVPTGNRKKTLAEEYELAILNFKHIAGLELDSMVEVEDSFLASGPVPDLEKLTALAKKYRPELNIGQAQEEIDLLNVKLSQAEKYPVVLLAGAYEYQGSKLTYLQQDWTANWNVNVSLALPVFDGGAWISRLRQKNIQYKKARLNRSRIHDIVIFEVRSSYISFCNALARQAGAESFSAGARNKLDRPLPAGEAGRAAEEYFKAAAALLDAARECSIGRAALEAAVGAEL